MKLAFFSALGLSVTLYGIRLRVSGVLAKFAKIVTYLLGENDDAAVKHGCGNTLGIKQETGFR